MKNLVLLICVFSVCMLSGQSKMTTFDVKKHGFQFYNSFKTTVGDQGSVKLTTGGLCGGMSYAAADYFFARKSAPSTRYRPVTGSSLHKYIENRQYHSFKSLDKWIELTFNPFGARNEEFFYWGLEKRLYVDLKNKIDKNQPLPLGLATVSSNIGENHQVLAIGYDMGGYSKKRDKDPKKDKVRIYIYDPNKPGEICVLIPNSKQRYYEEWITEYKRGRLIPTTRTKYKWRTYFIDENYSRKTPPKSNNKATKSSTKINKLVVSICTGNDDLRGGNDNLNIIVNMTGGRVKRNYNVNRSKRWPDKHWEHIEVRLDNPVKESELNSLKLETTFKGGMGGDNWNVDVLKVIAHRENGKTKSLFYKSKTPLKRFTGSSKTYNAWFK